jgi:hypothetical protein
MFKCSLTDSIIYLAISHFSSDLPTTSFTGATVETSIADADLVLIYDDSATAVRKMTKANLVAGIGGKVIQVVTATDSTERSTTSTSYVTGSNTLSVSITPSSTSNKILIVTSFLGFQGTGRGTWSLYRGATNLTTNGIMYNDWNSSAVNVYIGYSYLDSPSSTSSLTYQPYMKISSGTVYMNVGNSVGTITALEIAG